MDDRKIHENIERMVVGRVIADALAAGYAISVNDGEETTVKRSIDPAAILKAMFTTGEDYLLVHGRVGNHFAREHFAWVRFVYGNCGWEVVNDYTTNIEALMEPICRWCEEIEDGKVAIPPAAA